MSLRIYLGLGIFQVVCSRSRKHKVEFVPILGNEKAATVRLASIKETNNDGLNEHTGPEGRVGARYGNL
jgi:hypothetical protein